MRALYARVTALALTGGRPLLPGVHPPPAALYSAHVKFPFSLDASERTRAFLDFPFFLDFFLRPFVGGFLQFRAPSNFFAVVSDTLSCAVILFMMFFRYIPRISLGSSTPLSGLYTTAWYPFLVRYMAG